MKKDKFSGHLVKLFVEDDIDKRYLVDEIKNCLRVSMGEILFNYKY